MKKIMFNDRYGLTQAVLDGRKTMTRRIIKLDELGEYNLANTFNQDWGEVSIQAFIKNEARYKVGEIAAIAQSYASIVDELEDPKNFYCMEHWESASPMRAHYCGFLYHPGMTNKMFVSADEMPHQIRITNIRVERLQDISDEDCIKEGIIDCSNGIFNHYSFTENTNIPNRIRHSPREAFAALIDKVSGKGTWGSNPFVFAYEFELVK